MSVYKPKGTEIFVYDFQWRGHRFSGSTGAKSKREALAVEDRKRDEAKKRIAEREALENAPMTLDVACDRYWLEKGQYTNSAKQIESHIEYLLTHLGEKTLLSEITNDKVAALVAKRRADFVDNIMKRKAPKKGTLRAPQKRISNATVNRTTIEPLKRILFRARDLWGQKIGLIEWKKHKLEEPDERVRAASANEEERYFATLAPEYHQIAYYAIRTGCRAMECVNLRRKDIDWSERTILVTGKGGKARKIPMPLDVRDVLYPIVPNSEGYMFLLPSKTRKDRAIESPQRITYRGFYSAHRRACERAGIDDLRIHDLRHTAATRLLKATGNLKMAQQLLRHSNIRTTAKYAHVFDDELRDALDQMPMRIVPVKTPQVANKRLIKKAK